MDKLFETVTTAQLYLGKNFGPYDNGIVEEWSPPQYNEFLDSLQRLHESIDYIENYVRHVRNEMRYKTTQSYVRGPFV